MEWSDIILLLTLALAVWIIEGVSSRRKHRD